jgi:hypothetical protein
MKLQASVLLFATAILAACSGSAGSQSSTSDESVNCATAKFQACNTPSDCKGSLREGSTWGCTNDTPLAACNYAEPVCVAVSGSSSSGSCKSASECSGALPRNEEQCADGTFSGASWECRSDSCVISYCKGHTTPSPSASGTCNQATDCTGALPRTELQCEDGNFGGASWACNSGACTIAYCANDGGPASSGGSGDGGSSSGGDSGGGSTGEGDGGGGFSGDDGGVD